MRVLVAGATSVPGLPLLRELNARGHDVVGLTSQPAKTSQIEQHGAKPVVASVFDTAQIDKVVADIEPEVVVSLLTTLPKWGPKRPKDFEPARKLWGRGAPNLVDLRAASRRPPGGGGVSGLRVRLPDIRPAVDGRDRPVPGSAVPPR
jgi:NAD(P)-dependent dehydrogenase (short-subunit alcohol dehydrogenase family)